VRRRARSCLKHAIARRGFAPGSRCTWCSGRAGAGVLLHAIHHYPFDRYILPAVVPAAILVAAASHRHDACATDGLLCAVRRSVRVLDGGVQDYMACNTARWEALRYLQEERNVAPEQIAGGYEFNGIYTSARYLADRKIKDFWQCGANGWWILDDSFSVARTPADGYAILKTFPYFTYFGMKQRVCTPSRATPLHDDTLIRRWMTRWTIFTRFEEETFGLS